MQALHNDSTTLLIKITVFSESQNEKLNVGDSSQQSSAWL